MTDGDATVNQSCPAGPCGWSGGSSGGHTILLQRHKRNDLSFEPPVQLEIPFV
jgi:hypothetical protein